MPSCSKCEKEKRLTCHKWYDGYRTALLALEDDRVMIKEEYNVTGIDSKNAQGKLGKMINNLKPANTVKEKIRAEIVRLAQLHFDMLAAYRSTENTRAAAVENVLYGHDLSILSFIDSMREEPTIPEIIDKQKE